MKSIQTDILKKITISILICVSLISSSKARVHSFEVDYGTSKTGKELYLYYIDRICSMDRYKFYPDLQFLIQAMMELESNYDASVVSSTGCVGPMQISPYWQADRAAKLGVDIYTPYGNILTAVDFLRDLYFNYADQDMVLAVMMYNMDFSKARAIRSRGQLTEYALDAFWIYEELKNSK